MLPNLLVVPGQPRPQVLHIRQRTVPRQLQRNHLHSEYLQPTSTATRMQHNRPHGRTFSHRHST